MNDTTAMPDNGAAPAPEENPSVHAVIMCGPRVEIAADILSQLHLCPRDKITLAAALVCAVVEEANTHEGSPFLNINTDSPETNPFKIAIAGLQEVDSWGNGGAEIPDSAVKHAAPVPNT